MWRSLKQKNAHHVPPISSQTLPGPGNAPPLAMLWLGSASLALLASAACTSSGGGCLTTRTIVRRHSMVLSSATGPAFCEQCGEPMERRVPAGDERERSCCTACAHIAYQNPKVVVGAVCQWEGKVLLCQRAIPPCEGKWGFPQGFLELSETASMLTVVPFVPHSSPPLRPPRGCLSI